MAKYDRYVLCNFSYFDKDDRLYSLVYMGTEQNLDKSYCSHCNGVKHKLTYLFSEENTGIEFRFGSCCVKKVFGAGLK